VSPSAWLRAALSLCLCLLALLVPLALGAPVLPPSKKEIADWVRDLGAREFSKRERAQRRLWEAGAIAEDAVREAAKSTDPEVGRRAQAIYRKFHWGIYPNTPKKIATLIEQYQAANPTAKLQVVRQLFDEGAAGCAALLKVAGAEDNPALKKELFSYLAREAGRAVPLMIAEGKYSTLDTLVELSLQGDLETALPSYAAYQLLRGRLAERIAHFRKQASAAADPTQDREVLFYLLRAKGDVDGALALADQLKRPEWAAGLLEEQGRWMELAGREDALSGHQPSERLGFKAAYQRLAGQKKELEETLAEIRKSAEGKDPGSTEVWHAAKALFLNDRPEDALALLKKGTGAVARVEILAGQMKYAEALKFAEKAREDSPLEADAIDLQRARILYFLGEKEKARQLFATLAEKLKQGNNLSWFDDLVQWEYRLGMKEQAFEHCARALLLEAGTYGQTRLLKKVLPGQEETAQAWWAVLRRKQASEDALVSMKSLRTLLAGKIKGKELTSLTAEAEGLAQTLRPAEASQTLQAAGEVALKAGEEELARTYFVKAAATALSPAPLVRWADHLADKKQWEPAAEAYHQAWQTDRKQPLALFLRGQMLIRLGKKKAGEALLDQSHWLALGDERVRLEFARDLASRGYTDAARRERELIRTTSPVGSFYAGESLRLSGIEAYREKDYLRSAQLHDRALLRVLRAYVNFLEPSAYVVVPAFVHRMRALGLVKAGKMDEAQKHIDFCLSALPGHPELATALVPELDKRGHRKEADALFEKVKTTKSRLCRDFPKSAGLANSLAWVCASCKRDLENAQKLAEKAVKLEPGLPGYRDTLAEILFQSGHKDQAISNIKKCIELDPKREYYRKQLKRFEAGDPKAELPLDVR
jgi:predicted Zn-dependent protease